MKYLIIILVTSLFLPLRAQEMQTINIPLSDPGKRGRLEVQIMKGPVTVIGTSRKDVLVKYQPMGSQGIKMEDVGGGLKKISGGFSNLEISESHNRVDVESHNMNKGMKVIIEVPVSFDLEINTFNDGNVLVENIKGEVTAEAHNGKIEARKISGSVIASSFNGGIKLQFDELAANTPLAFTNYNGEIDITLPASTKADFKFKMMQGDIYTAFDMNIKPVMLKNKDEDSGGFSLDGWMSGTINGGGPEFRIESHHGDIYIRKN